MGRRQQQEDQEAADTATVAILRGLSRNGHQRGVLAELTPAEQAEVFAAEARHRRR
jgi:hypothetical protein